MSDLQSGYSAYPQLVLDCAVCRVGGSQPDTAADLYAGPYKKTVACNGFYRLAAPAAGNLLSVHPGRLVFYRSCIRSFWSGMSGAASTSAPSPCPLESAKADSLPLHTVGAASGSVSELLAPQRWRLAAQYLSLDNLWFKHCFSAVGAATVTLGIAFQAQGTYLVIR